MGIWLGANRTGMVRLMVWLRPGFTVRGTIGKMRPPSVPQRHNRATQYDHGEPMAGIWSRLMMGVENRRGAWYGHDMIKSRNHKPLPRHDHVVLGHLIHQPGEGQTYTTLVLRKSDLRDTQIIAYDGALFVGPSYYFYKPDGIEFFYSEATMLPITEPFREGCLVAWVIEQIATTVAALPAVAKPKRRNRISPKGLEAMRANAARARAAKLQRKSAS